MITYPFYAEMVVVTVASCLVDNKESVTLYLNVAVQSQIFKIIIYVDEKKTFFTLPTEY